MDTQLRTYFERYHISYKLHKHPAVFTVEQSKKEPLIEKIPGIRTKNLFLKDENKEFYLVSIAGEKRLDMRLLERHLNVKHLEFGNAQELKEELNVTPGSVSIFAMIYAKTTRLIVDKDVFDAEIASFHPNINTETIELKRESLKKFLNTLSCKKEVLELE